MMSNENKRKCPSTIKHYFESQMTILYNMRQISKNKLKHKTYLICLEFYFFLLLGFRPKFIPIWNKKVICCFPIYNITQEYNIKVRHVVYCTTKKYNITLGKKYHLYKCTKKSFKER